MRTLKKIVLTGGGTAGHVMPHLAMLEIYRQHSVQVEYIGSDGVEKSLMEDAGVPFNVIRAGKLRRYFSIQNFFDIFNIFIATIQSLLILRRIRPEVIFSKGGFVSVPVCVAGWLLRIPVLSHESDYTPGLATRIIATFATKILCTFEDTKNFLGSNSRCEAVGTPIRVQLKSGVKERGMSFCGLDPNDHSRSTLLIIGGTQGSQRINNAIADAIDVLLSRYQIIHICGKDKLTGIKQSGYFACEFAGLELADMIAASDLVISRAGANTIFELLSANKPMLLIPLEVGSRGDQVHNATYFKNKGWAEILRETQLDASALLNALEALQSKHAMIKDRQAEYSCTHPEKTIFAILKSAVRP